MNNKNNIQDNKINEQNETMTILGYDAKKIEILLNLLNTLPVKTFPETQAKYKIYEILMSPEYDLQPKESE